MRPKSAMESARSTWETRSAASDTPARSFGFGGSLSGLSGEHAPIMNNYRNEGDRSFMSSLQNLMDNQNQNLALILKEVVGPNSRRLNLPIFNPDVHGSNARAWSSTVELILSENMLSNSELILALSGALKGSSSQWLSQVTFPGITWPIFKQLFITEYDEVDTPAAMIYNLLNEQPKPHENYVSFGMRMLNVISARWNNLTMDEISISFVLAHLAKIDGRIRRVAFNTNINTREQLLKELNYISQTSNNKRPLESTSRQFDSNKRFKSNDQANLSPNTSVFEGERCKICRKLGHRTSACWWKEPAPFKTGSLQGSKQQLNPAIRSNSYRRDHQGDLAKCYTCGDTSHFANKCPNRGPKAGASSFQPKEKASRYVNLCEKNPSGSLTHQGTDD
uniref:Capsid protein n=1 Tax=Lygus hesperus TaxID=30085 RepID=A0A0A9YDB1_LYGHE